MPGELLGSDGLSRGIHQEDVIALVDSDVCRSSAEDVASLMADVPAISCYFNRLLADEVQRQRGLMSVLRHMDAEQRLAMFLLNIGKRLQKRGYSRTEFVLPMSRGDIGCYLGLKQETVSRTLASLCNSDLIAIDNRQVHILQVEALREIRNSRVN